MTRTKTYTAKELKSKCAKRCNSLNKTELSRMLKKKKTKSCPTCKPKARKKQSTKAKKKTTRPKGCPSCGPCPPKKKKTTKPKTRKEHKPRKSRSKKFDFPSTPSYSYPTDIEWAKGYEELWGKGAQSIGEGKIEEVQQQLQEAPLQAQEVLEDIGLEGYTPIGKEENIPALPEDMPEEAVSFPEEITTPKREVVSKSEKETLTVREGQEEAYLQKLKDIASEPRRKAQKKAYYSKTKPDQRHVNNIYNKLASLGYYNINVDELIRGYLRMGREDDEIIPDIIAAIRDPMGSDIDQPEIDIKKQQRLYEKYLKDRYGSEFEEQAKEERHLSMDEVKNAIDREWECGIHEGLTPSACLDMGRQTAIMPTNEYEGSEFRKNTEPLHRVGEPKYHFIGKDRVSYKKCGSAYARDVVKTMIGLTDDLAFYQNEEKPLIMQTNGVTVATASDQKEEYERCNKRLYVPIKTYDTWVRGLMQKYNAKQVKKMAKNMNIRGISKTPKIELIDEILERKLTEGRL